MNCKHPVESWRHCVNCRENSGPLPKSRNRYGRGRVAKQRGTKRIQEMHGIHAFSMTPRLMRKIQQGANKGQWSAYVRRAVRAYSGY